MIEAGRDRPQKFGEVCEVLDYVPYEFYTKDLHPKVKV